MAELTTTMPPVFRALRLLAAGLPAIAHALDEPLHTVENWAAGTERMPTYHALYLTLFAATWQSIVARSARRIPGRFQLVERQLSAALELCEAQDRINESIAVGADYTAAYSRWKQFEERGRAAWDEFAAMVAAAPKANEHIIVNMGENEIH